MVIRVGRDGTLGSSSRPIPCNGIMINETTTPGLKANALHVAAQRRLRGTTTRQILIFKLVPKVELSSEVKYYVGPFILWILEYK